MRSKKIGLKPATDAALRMFFHQKNLLGRGGSNFGGLRPLSDWVSRVYMRAKLDKI